MHRDSVPTTVGIAGGRLVWGNRTLGKMEVGTLLHAYSIRTMAKARLAAGDSSSAEGDALGLGRLPGIWQWEALRLRADIALARSDTARADSLLAAASRDDWPEADRAAWLALRVRLRAALGDTTQALDLARQAIRRYPSLGSTVQALETLEALTQARGERLSSDDEIAAAEVDFFRSAYDRAAARLRRVLPELGERRGAVGLRLGEILRRRRRFDDAARALEEAAARSPEGTARARCLLEGARAHRDAGRRAKALSGFESAARMAADTTLAATAWWEAAEEAEAGGDVSRARRTYEPIAAGPSRRAQDARLRVGFLWLGQGERAKALAAWGDANTEATAFWRAVLASPRDDAALDSLARLPGVTFYRAAARETLGVMAWPGTIARDSCGPDSLCEGLALARDLVWIGEDDDAMFVLARVAAGDPRIPGGAAARRAPAALLDASRLAFACGRVPAGIRYARLSEEAGGGPSWDAVPWVHPPAFDSIYRALPERTERGRVDRGLARAITWQESRFDPVARSRSDALGLMQLKVSTAGDVAKWLRDPAPTEATLFDPPTNVRYGVRYFEWLLGRFDGRVSVALAAYNAGPSRIPERWRELLDRGGEALFAELAGTSGVRDYVQRILTARSGYRELAPVVAPE